MIAPADASRPGILIGRRFDLDRAPGFGFSPDGKTVFVTYAGEAPQFLRRRHGSAARRSLDQVRVLQLAAPGAVI
jgi:hypothetical protein